MKKLSHNPLIWIIIIAVLSALIYIRFANVGARQNDVDRSTNMGGTNTVAGLQMIPSQLKSIDQVRTVKDWVDSETGQKLALNSNGGLSLSSSNGFTVWTTNILYLWSLLSTNHDYVIGTNGVGKVDFFGDRIEMYIHQTNIDVRVFEVIIDRKTGECKGFVGE
jgi:hypothetical protein